MHPTSGAPHQFFGALLRPSSLPGTTPEPKFDLTRNLVSAVREPSLPIFKHPGLAKAVFNSPPANVEEPLEHVRPFCEPPAKRFSPLPLRP